MLRWAVNCAGWRPTSGQWCAAMASVQAEERERICRFVFQREAKLALVGRLLLRAAVVEEEGVGNREVELGRSERGKPFVLHPKGQRLPMEINISHQGKYCVLATERGRAVGVDIMSLTRPSQGTADFFHTMRRQFTDEEWCHIRACTREEEQLAVFYRLWCLKESFIKAEGTGLSYGLQRLSFTPANPWPPAIRSVCLGSKLHIDCVLANNWQFQESLIDQEHCVAVAVDCSHGNRALGATPTFTERSVSDLLSSLTPLTPADPAHWTHYSTVMQAS